MEYLQGIKPSKNFRVPRNFNDIYVSLESFMDDLAVFNYGQHYVVIS